MPTFPPKVRYELTQRTLVVQSVDNLTRRMVRVTLGGPELAGFRTDGPHDHVKLGVATTDSDDTVWRDYTVRRFDPETPSIDIDLVVHGHGDASTWAGHVTVGDEVTIRGPRGSRPMPIADHYILLGDLSSLPAIGRWLEHIPSSATGAAIVAVHDADDEIDLEASPDISVEWLHAGDQPVTATLLAPAAQKLVPPDRDHYLWAAGEVGAIRAVRDALVEGGFSRDNLGLQGYWRHGHSGHDHHAPLDAD